MEVSLNELTEECGTLLSMGSARIFISVNPIEPIYIGLHKSGEDPKRFGVGTVLPITKGGIDGCKGRQDAIKASFREYNVLVSCLCLPCPLKYSCTRISFTVTITSVKTRYSECSRDPEN